MKKLINIYEDNTLPIIMVYIQGYKIKKAENMKNYIQNELLNEGIDVITILVKDEEDTIEPYDIKQLINKSIKKTENAINYEYYIFIKERFKKEFIENFEKKKY